MTDEDREAAAREFAEVVNMSPAELEKWLQTEDSQAVGWTHEGEGEAIGHQSGRRIVEIKRKKRADLSDEDYAHMRKVVGYVHRHMAQGGPAEDKAHSRWRYSLMNWGHDPLK
jgi:predicted ATP-dependent protease